MDTDAARRTFLSMWNRIRRALIREAPTPYEEARGVVEDRRRFWAEFREGQRESEAACLEAERVLKATPVV